MISSIILAAGMSKRMKQGNKLLLKYNQSNILQNTIQNLTESNIDEIIIVLGHGFIDVKRTLRDTGGKIIFNEEYYKGMSSSIIKGIQSINPKSKGVMVCLGDMPKVKTETYNKLINVFNNIKKKKKIILPVFNDQIGNPIIFTSYFFKSLLNLAGDKGAKKLINKHENCVIQKQVQDKGVLEDIDNDAQYNFLKNKND